MRSFEQGWCILRTAGRSTLRLAESLRGEGFDVWAPVRTRIARVPRKNARRTVMEPMLPSFVFARAVQRDALLRRSRIPGSGFKLFSFDDDFPEIADRELDGLRRMEAKLALAKRAEKAFARDEDVRVTEGPWGGMEGAVIRSNKGKTLVLIGGRQRVEFFTFILKPISRIREEIAAQAA